MSRTDVYKVSKCRICDTSQLSTVLSLGSMPIPNGFIRKDELKKKEKVYPLELCRCLNCGLVQVAYIVDASVMFKNYLYIPSASRTRIENFNKIAEQTAQIVKLTENDLVVDIGSNDGSLLTCFKNKGVNVCGVDPAENLAKVAELNGIPTISAFFDKKTAKKILQSHGHAKIITATNVFAHIDNIKDVLDAIAMLLTDEGIFVAQFPYLLDLIEKNQFDTIYHEHLSYFSLQPLIHLTQRTDLVLYDIQHDELDGGSLKVFWKKKGGSLDSRAKRITAFANLEKKKHLYEQKTYDAFAMRVERLKEKTKKKLLLLKKKNKKIAGYGAAAKGNILLHYFELDPEIISYLVDSTPYKQGLYTPGTHIPIFSESRIAEEPVDYILILAWNFAKEIIKKNTSYKKDGGKFIVTMPDFQIL